MSQRETASRSQPSIPQDGHSARPPMLHIVCDWDVGLFNLFLGVITHTHWALSEGRIPIIYYTNRNCYWTPSGYRGCNTVWEYYFEPVIPEYPASRIPSHVIKAIANNPPERKARGSFVDDYSFVTSDGAWHITIDGEGLRGPPTNEPYQPKGARGGKRHHSQIYATQRLHYREGRSLLSRASLRAIRDWRPYKRNGRSRRCHEAREADPCEFRQVYCYIAATPPEAPWRTDLCGIGRPSLRGPDT
jgi:hypothetical protein